MNFGLHFSLGWEVNRKDEWDTMPSHHRKSTQSRREAEAQSHRTVARKNRR